MIVAVGAPEIKCQQSGRRARDDGQAGGRNRASSTYSALF